MHAHTCRLCMPYLGTDTMGFVKLLLLEIILPPQKGIHAPHFKLPEGQGLGPCARAIMISAERPRVITPSRMSPLYFRMFSTSHRPSRQAGLSYRGPGLMRSH